MGTRVEYTYRNHSYPAIGNYALLFSSLGVSDEGLTLPIFTVEPEVEIVAVNVQNIVTILSGSKSISGLTFQHGTGPTLPPFTFTFRIIAREDVLDDTFDFYGSVSEAAALAGVSAGALTTAMQKQVNSWIDNKIHNGNSFEVHIQTDEYHDIDDPLPGKLLIDSLLLLNRPVIAISSLVDDARGSDPTTVDSDAYYLDRDGETGILRLETKNVTGANTISGFTKGRQSAKVSYTWGFSAVPAKIQELATLMLAKWGEINARQTLANGLREIEAGDYKEKLDYSFLDIKSKYDDQINMLTKELREKYYQFV